MTNYQKFNQNDYLPNLTHINSLLSSKNQQPLQQLLSPQAYTVLIHLINKLKTTMETPPKKHKHFQSSYFLTKNYVKTKLHLSYTQFTKAVDTLIRFNLVTVSSYYVVLTEHNMYTYKLKLSNFQNFIQFFKKYKKIQSNPNHSFSDLLYPLKTYLNSTYTFNYEDQFL